MADRTCSVDGCNGAIYARGWCIPHYSKWRDARQLQRIDRPCTIDGCDRPQRARGWCRMHYRRWLEHGTTDPHPRHQPVVERFWRFIDKNGPVPAYAPRLGSCWLWTGAIMHGGYGQIRLRPGTRTMNTHRFAYELLVGPIPDGLHLDHLCRVPRCCNPLHLEPVTQAENSRRGARAIRDGWAPQC